MVSSYLWEIRAMRCVSNTARGPRRRYGRSFGCDKVAVAQGAAGQDSTTHRPLVPSGGRRLGNLFEALQRMGHWRQSGTPRWDHAICDTWWRWAGHATRMDEAEPHRWISAVLGWRDAWWRYTVRCLHGSSARFRCMLTHTSDNFSTVRYMRQCEPPRAGQANKHMCGEHRWRRSWPIASASRLAVASFRNRRTA